MKSTGIVRKTDELGRIVLPIELRRTLDIEYKDGLEIFIEEDRIILKKYQPACVFCGNAEGVKGFKGKFMCSQCSDLLSQKEA
ncbi:MAG: AbrB/MazE/SpoVT family DNA-binding domain-containing protein [Negativicutes bacterium]|nr:AbrB/MazE/SpoVT family DNA-binding domain-containing protein [Negativicutes bacterium]